MAMRRAALALILLVGACREEPRPVAADRPDMASACVQQMFEESRFIVCSPNAGRIEIRTAGKDNVPYRSFATLEASLGERSEQVQFAMNGGMFDKEGRAIGLSIEDGKELHTINLRKGLGNFHLRPNGVFLVRDQGQAEIVTSPNYKSSPDIAFANQSGPMLVIDGQIHPAFEYDGPSRYERNGVGIDPKGQPVFVISQEGVSFGKFARLFRDRLGARNALYLDGSVSSLWDPIAGRRDRSAPLGPMILAFKAAASDRNREAPARP